MNEKTDLTDKTNDSGKTDDLNEIFFNEVSKQFEQYLNIARITDLTKLLEKEKPKPPRTDLPLTLDFRS